MSQVIVLNRKLSEETNQADKAELEIKTKSDKLKNLESEQQVSDYYKHN